MSAKTLFDKVWDQHVVKVLDGGWVLLHIDRVLLHDLSGTASLNALRGRALPVAQPTLAFATPDHAVSSAPGRGPHSYPPGGRLWNDLRARCDEAGIRFFDIGQPGHGIVHVMGPELGLIQPGLTAICGDSHTCTNGALGALAFGVGTSELAHALATQTLRLRKPRTMRLRLVGTRAEGVTAKDVILHAIGVLGTGAGTGYAIEYAGPIIEEMEMEERMTVCNLSIEMGARIGMIAPDSRCLDFLRGRPHAPSPLQWPAAAQAWLALRGDADAVFDRDETLDITALSPTITWGTSPEHVMPIDGRIPDPGDCADADDRLARQRALAYMGLAAGAPIAGQRIDRAFIGSCANGRLSDLEAAARVVRGKHVAAHVQAWVVPGSEAVKRAAEAQGLDQVFRAAGFEWREPGCSMCVAANGEIAAPEERVVSTTNRNFVGRQGPRVRTHLASPATVAASALAGVITAAGRL
ncbi:3-isopropylmalate dehydratase large subunit [Achromobacter aloeverae]|uniref:3-isopropylmalate dehydratase n=1 Tax=Achromobacter aloeverae TaxID=1750518 RepID=A0A4Q1HG93_9BURK|nr:3-isopropylmalate dehydratase large subunit [Achromobacter aloeverae]RXN86129.1 3-isopropylmalate dehydratase [Achromobacter aloeverae]